MTKYLLSYTAASLRRAECMTLARAYAENPDWSAIRRQCVDDDILMLRLESSRKRVSGELIKRLENLDGEELAFLASLGDARAQSAVLWIAVCRTYEFVRDFVEQVAGPRWLESKGDLPLGAYEAFFEESAVVHQKLAALKESTRPRLRNQLYQMLREMGFIDREDRLQPYLLPAEVERLVGPVERAYFPTIV